MKRRMAGLLEAPATASGGGGGSDIRSAFRSAIASATAGKDVAVRHRPSAKDVESDEGGDAGGDEGEADADDDDQDEDADEGAEDQDDDADEGEDDAEDEGEGDADDADDDADEGDEEDADAEGDEDDEDDEPGERQATKHALNDEREFRKLQDKYKDDPKGLRRELLKTFTQKTQDIAKERKQYKGLLSYLPLAEALERNPIAAVKRLAKIYDLRVVDDDGTETATPAARGKGKGRTAATADDGEDTKDFIDGILKDFKADLGPELEYLADGLGPAMTKALQKMADRTVSTRVKSLEDATVELARSQGSAESDRVMESFYRTHKDHADYEDEMDELARQLVGEGDNIRPIPMSEGEFLEFLYDTVKARRAASGQKETIKAEARRLMKKRLKKLATARNGDRRPSSVPEERVRRRPRGPVSIRDAFKAARQGITFDDNDDE